MAAKKKTVPSVTAKDILPEEGKQVPQTPNIIIGHDDEKSAMEVAIDQEMPILLIGETGTGKTSIVRELAHKYGKQMMRVNLNGQTSTYEFVGKWLIKNQQTEWVDGILVQAMRNGWWILCDEINAALPEILFVLHSLLDDDRMVMLSEKDGEIVRPHPDFRFFATMNPMDEYAGTKELNKAFVSRFGMVLEIEYPATEIEVEILVNRGGVVHGDAVAMAEFAKRVRKDKFDGKIYHTVSTRDLLHWATLSKKLGINKAFMHAILFKAHKDDHKALAKHWEDVGGKIKELLVRMGVKNFDSLLGLIAQKAEQVEKEWNALDAAKKGFDKEKETIREEILQEILGNLGSSVKTTGGNAKQTHTLTAKVAENREITPDDILNANTSEDLPF